MLSFISLAVLPRQDVFLRQAVFLAALLLLLRVNNNAVVVKGQAFNGVRFEELVDKMESDVIELANAVENEYATRCETDTINECEQGNYLDCLSSFPNQECRGGLDYSSPDCNGSGDNSSTTKCSSFFDFTISSIRLPLALAFGDNWNPRDQSVKEAICFSRRLDPWFIQKRAKDSGFWKELLNSTEPPLNSMFFGSHHGPFRIYPARVSKGDCGDYDARIRPWYIAASSGPKNVVLMLDISGVMDDRMTLLKQASQRVVNATTIHDRITVVTFSSTANAYTTDGGYMFKATDDNKQILNDAIANLTALGGTDYYEAFDKAFNVLDKTIANELNTPCNTAVIFLTDDGDGNQKLGKSLSEVKSLVATRMKNVSDAIEKPVILFTYSLSSSNHDNNAFDTNVFPAEVACEVEYGVWSHISNDNDLLDALSNYYRLFALGLGSSQDQNDTFVAWVDPYLFATPSKGTTVSRAVYDRRSSDHPIFLGVVGINFDLRALDAALSSGITATAKEKISQEVIRRIGILSNSRCPRELKLTACELDAYQVSSHSFDRQNNNQSISFCDRGCTDPDSVSVQETVCDGEFYPNDLWNNTHFLLQDASYTDRFCCKNNTEEGAATPAEVDVCLAAAAAVPTSPVDEQSNSNSNNGDTGGGGLSSGAIAGIALSLVAVMAGIILLFYSWKRGGVFARDKKGGSESPSPITMPPPPATNPCYAMWETTAPTAP